MNAPKLHHYVPQFHLRRFADAKGRLWVWDKTSDRMFGTMPGRIAAETQFYQLTQYEAECHDPLTMEKQLSVLEGEVAKITDQWLEWLPDMAPLDVVPVQEVGKCTRIIVFISTTRAAILMRRRRSVSNWATRHIERFGIDTRRPHISQYAPACRNSRS